MLRILTFVFLNIYQAVGGEIIANSCSREGGKGRSIYILVQETQIGWVDFVHDHSLHLLPDLYGW